jgi:hypothetical protein
MNDTRINLSILAVTALAFGSFLATVGGLPSVHAPCGVRGPVVEGQAG